MLCNLRSSYLAVGVAGASLPPTGQYRGVLSGSATLTTLLLHWLLIQWLGGAGWVGHGVRVGVRGQAVSGLGTGFGHSLSGLGVRLLWHHMVLQSLLKPLARDQHSLAHLWRSSIGNGGQVGVGDS